MSVSHLRSDVSKPTQRSWTMLRRIGRCLERHQRVQYKFEEQSVERGPEWTVYSDTDWAGCGTTRKSRSGDMILTSGGLIPSWSNRQGSAALSSGAAEFCFIPKHPIFLSLILDPTCRTTAGYGKGFDTETFWVGQGPRGPS